MRLCTAITVIALSFSQSVSAVEWPVRYVVRAALQSPRITKLPHQTRYNMDQCFAEFTSAGNRTAVLMIGFTQAKCSKSFRGVKRLLDLNTQQTLVKEYSEPFLVRSRTNPWSIRVNVSCSTEIPAYPDFSMVPMDLDAPSDLCIKRPFTRCKVTEIGVVDDDVTNRYHLEMSMLCDDPSGNPSWIPDEVSDPRRIAEFAGKSQPPCTPCKGCMTLPEIATVSAPCVIVILFIGIGLGCAFVRWRTDAATRQTIAIASIPAKDCHPPSSPNKSPAEDTPQLPDKADASSDTQISHVSNFSNIFSER